MQISNMDTAIWVALIGVVCTVIGWFGKVATASVTKPRSLNGVGKDLLRAEIAIHALDCPGRETALHLVEIFKRLGNIELKLDRHIEDTHDKRNKLEQ